MVELNQKHLRVAVVDDDTTMLSMLNELLTEEGYVVTAFTDGSQVKQAAYHNPFDIVVSDINMPEVSGIELLRYLREIKSKAKVIIMTADAELKSAIEAVKLGAFDYLKKPFENIDDVITLINRASNEIISEKRKDNLVQAVIEKTKHLISYQSNLNMPDNLQGVMDRLEGLVNNLQDASGSSDASRRKLSGNIQEIGLPNLLQMFTVVGKSGKFILDGLRYQGEIWFSKGKIVSALCGNVKGKKAVFRLLVQDDGKFDFVIYDEVNVDNNLDAESADFLILDSLRSVDEYKRLGRRVPPGNLYVKIKSSLPKDLNPVDQKVLELILRYSRVQDILDYSEFSDLDTIYGLIRLRMADLLDIAYG